MKVASVTDAIDARAALKEQGLACTLHLHDACGSQTLSIEMLEGTSDETLGKARTLLSEFFAARHLPIEYSKTDDTIFYIR